MCLEQRPVAGRVRCVLDEELEANNNLPAAILRNACEARLSTFPTGPTSPNHPASLIPRDGGYCKLKSFHVAQLFYDARVVSCEGFLPQSSGIRDRVVQTSLSGVQNIGEGSMASATSQKTELKLTGVAWACREELLYRLSGVPAPAWAAAQVEGLAQGGSDRKAPVRSVGQGGEVGPL